MKIFFSSMLSFIVAATMLASCGNESAKTSTSKNSASAPKDDELSSFMLGGIYFIHGYGGKAAVDAQIIPAGTDKEQLISSYRELFLFPFSPDDKSGAQKTLSEWWEVKSKEDLVKILDELKNHKLKSSTHKSWDYARLVNNVCMGYAAGYLTKDEGKKFVMEILPLAKAEYKTWDAYFADFVAGRNAWDNSPSKDKTDFENLGKTITQGEHNIYQLLPLNN